MAVIFRPQQLTARQRAFQEGLEMLQGGIDMGARAYQQNEQAQRDRALQALNLSNQISQMGQEVTPEIQAQIGQAVESGDYGSLSGVFSQARQGQLQRQRELEAQKLQREQQQRDLDYQRQLQKDQRQRDFELKKLGMQQLYKGMDRQQKIADKAKEKSKILGKDQKEFARRFSSIVSEAENLKDLIDKKGTFEAFGPHENILNQKLESLAVDAAKLYDPQSVARESEVQSFKNMLFEPGLMTTNKTAKGTLDAFVQLMKDRASREAGLENNEQLSTYLSKFGAEQKQVPTNYVIASPTANEFLKNKDISQLTDEELMQLEAEEMRARGIGNVR